MRHLFSLDIPTEAALREPDAAQLDAAGTGGTAEGPGAEHIAGGRNRTLQLQRLGDGFRLSGNGDGGMSKHAVVRVAYEVRRGNPFAQYQPPDFDLSRAPIDIAAEHAGIVQCTGNRLVVRIDAPDFNVTVRGFDCRRDIRVRLEAAPSEVEA